MVVRGRTFANDAYIIRRRAASLPADDEGFVPSLGLTGKVGLFANHAAEDAASIAAASRRHDRDFLHDVNNKLANLTATNYSVPAPSPSVYATPLPPQVRRRPPLPTSADLRRTTLRAPPVDDIEVAEFLARTPSTPLRYRSTSVPPLGRYQPTVPRWFPSSVVPPGRHGYGWWAAGGPPGKVLNASELRAAGENDAVVGVAHTALYGDIVIGIPYKKRFMFDAQYDGDYDTQSLPPAPYVSRGLPAASFASGRPASVAGYPPGGPAQLSRPYSRASYAGPSLAGQRSASAGLYDDIDDALSIKTYPGPALHQHQPHRRSVALRDRELEAEIAASQFGDDSLAKNYKLALSRYTNGPKPALANSEIDKKYDMILSSMRNKIPPSPVRPTTSNYSTPDYSSMPAPATKPRRPEMSDTRKKLRDLLCKSRGDPHYFDS